MISANLFSNENDSFYDLFLNEIEKRYMKDNWKLTSKNNETFFLLWRTCQLQINDEITKGALTAIISKDAVVSFQLTSDRKFDTYDDIRITLRDKNNAVIDNLFFVIYENKKTDDDMYSITFGPSDKGETESFAIPHKCKSIVYSLLNYDVVNFSIHCTNYYNSKKLKAYTQLPKLEQNDNTIDYLLYYAVIALDLVNVRKIFKTNPNIILEDKLKFSYSMCYMIDYYERNLKDIIDITKNRMISELLVEYGIDKAATYIKVDYDANILIPASE